MKSKRFAKKKRWEKDGTAKKPLSGSRMMVFKNFMLTIVEGPSPLGHVSRVAIQGLKENSPYVMVDLNRKEILVDDVETIRVRTKVIKRSSSSVSRAPDGFVRA